MSDPTVFDGGAERCHGRSFGRGSGGDSGRGSDRYEFDRYDEVTFALADPALVPVPATTSGPPGGVAWLRASVARFSSGEPHVRRRRLVQVELDRLDPAALRAAAAEATEPDPRLRVVQVLAAALGLADPAAVARDVALVARAYFADAPDDPAADAAVARLLPAVGAPSGASSGASSDASSGAGRAAEAAANRIGLLVQACDATATLVENARRGTGRPEPTLRDDPPVRAMRRLAVRDTEIGGIPVPAGTHVLLDIAAAQREGGAPDREPLTFGAPPRRCPGREHALAIASGILLGACSDEVATDTPDGLETAR
ncbi:hypothetical protein [Kitasatospora sp. NPDC097643]|uniref:hypothetical protein n=1 Tax=Kitasatospora sp. NPDC097643 TaxID=3157230 RepID=UPI0033328756